MPTAAAEAGAQAAEGGRRSSCRELSLARPPTMPPLQVSPPSWGCCCQCWVCHCGCGVSCWPAVLGGALGVVAPGVAAAWAAVPSEVGMTAGTTPGLPRGCRFARRRRAARTSLAFASTTTRSRSRSDGCIRSSAFASRVRRIRSDASGAPDSSSGEGGGGGAAAASTRAPAEASVGVGGHAPPSAPLLSPPSSPPAECVACGGGDADGGRLSSSRDCSSRMSSCEVFASRRSRWAS